MEVREREENMKNNNISCNKRKERKLQCKKMRLLNYYCKNKIRKKRNGRDKEQHDI